MPYAITLRLDADSAGRVEAMWAALAEKGISASMRRLGYAPHVTLAVYPDTAPAPALSDAVRRLAANWTILPLACPALGLFPDPPATLFVMATATEALLQRQASLCAALPDHPPAAHYQPGSWLPHITLADDLAANRAAAAVSATMANFTGFTAKLAGVDLLRFRPVKILWQTTLEPADTAM